MIVVNSIDFWLYRSYTKDMKTAISLPDRLYQEAERTAQDMGIPRSQLFAKALEEFIENHNHEKITEQLNNVYGEKDNNEFLVISNSSLESIRELTANDSW
jgi:metal-responsive CopG/Arc/MetJ family transcriptional regulator